MDAGERMSGGEIRQPSSLSLKPILYLLTSLCPLCVSTPPIALYAALGNQINFPPLDLPASHMPGARLLVLGRYTRMNGFPSHRRLDQGSFPFSVTAALTPCFPLSCCGNAAMFRDDLNGRQQKAPKLILSSKIPHLAV